MVEKWIKFIHVVKLQFEIILNKIWTSFAIKKSWHSVILPETRMKIRYTFKYMIYKFIQCIDQKLISFSSVQANISSRSRWNKLTRSLNFKQNFLLVFLLYAHYALCIWRLIVQLKCMSCDIFQSTLLINSFIIKSHAFSLNQNTVWIFIDRFMINMGVFLGIKYIFRRSMMLPVFFYFSWVIPLLVL